MSALDTKAVDEEAAQTLVYSILNDEQIKNYEHDLELNMALQVPNAGRFRVNLFHHLLTSPTYTQEFWKVGATDELYLFQLE